jgi:DNA polymerase
LSAQILEAEKPLIPYNDEFDISFPDTMRIEKYRSVVDWYRNPENRKYNVDPENPKSKKMQLEIDVAGVPTVFGWGGVHGAREQYTGEGYFINMDVASLYPSLMIRYNLHSRSCNPAKFNDIVDMRLRYKAEKNPLQAPLKIVINGTYGAMKDKNNPLYDPRQANNVCVYGQLLLLDLMEHLESYCQIIQSNTDGILIRMPDGQNPDDFFSLIDDICFEWETRTGLKLEFDEYKKVFQKDVNNYVIVDFEGKHKSKGAYVKKLSRLDYDLPIVNRALIEFMLHKVPVEVTISKCDDLLEFQQVKKISSKYDCILHGVKWDQRGRTKAPNLSGAFKINEKCVRAFASKLDEDGGLMMVHAKTKNPAKISETPEHAFLWNDSVNGVKCPDYLDKSWYIELARKRLKDFGVTI